MSAAEAIKVPLRSEVAVEDTWDLSPLFADDSAWDSAFAGLQENYPKIANFRGRLAQGPSALHECLETEKRLDMLAEKLAQFAALRVTEDGSNADALAREARLQNVLTRAAEAASFIVPEIQEIPDERFDQFLADPALADWQIPLKKLRRLKPHTLSANEERLLALGSSALEGHGETFSQLTNVDMRFGTITDPEGREREITQSTYSSMLQHQNHDFRRTVFRQFYKEFEEHGFTLAAAFSSSIRADVFYARAKNYPSALEKALFADDVPVSVYESLIESVRGGLPALFRYFEVRRKALGLDEIHHYDTYVPIVADVQTNISFDEAAEKVLRAVKPLGREYVEKLRAGLGSERWCDRYENKGKRSGAFSYGTFESPPYIMMNYKADVFSDVYTLAHEAGHSMHSWYSNRAQLYQNARYPIFLAEVASTFNECLLTEMLLRETSDPKMKAYILNRQIDDIRGTVYRQTMFAEFEKLAHAAEERGDAVTLATLREMYGSLLVDYFGPDFALDEQLQVECLRIPHFYNAFYVYKYATGLSAAVALSEQVMASGDAGRYLSFLKSGCSKFPIETLAAAGVDMRSPEPVAQTLALFARRVEELEKVLSEIS